MRNVFLLAMLAASMAASMALSACNTVAGAGEDVKSAGTAVTDTAEDAKK
jgi:predicted small secreted protein